MEFAKKEVVCILWDKGNGRCSSFLSYTAERALNDVWDSRYGERSFGEIPFELTGQTVMLAGLSNALSAYRRILALNR